MKKVIPTKPKFLERKTEVAPEQVVSQPESAPEHVAQNLIENSMDVDDKNKCDQCDFRSEEQYTLKQHKRDEHKELSESVTPPPKKRKDQINNIENEVELVVKQIEEMGVEEKVINNNNSKGEEVPKRLENMLRIGGLNIANNKLVRVGGGGLCGAKCLSIHTTGSETHGANIRTNINRHILEKWEIYCDSYEFPYEARVGGGTKVFKNQEELMIFLMEKPEEASTMWKTHVCMQAASTMLNMNIRILTTGIPSTGRYRCIRCKPSQLFERENDLIVLEEKEHQKKETEEEKEGRAVRARWTNLKPDYRIKDDSSEKAEELTLLHEDDIHYNIIVPKGHNISKTDTVKENKDNTESTIFGDALRPIIKPSYANITRAFRPKMTPTTTEAEPTNVIENVDVEGDEWKTVGPRGSAKKKTVTIEEVVSTKNKFEIFGETISSEHKCNDCEIECNS